MKTLLNIFTYLMFLCFSLTTLIVMIILSEKIFDEFVTMEFKYPDFWKIIIYAGCMCVVMVVNYFLPDFWKKHFKLNTDKPNRERKRNFTITGLLIDEPNNK